MYDVSGDETYDIRHDLAMLLADGEGDDELALAFTAELKQRGEALPVNYRWQHDMYARGGQRLVFELEGETQCPCT